jgi:pyruvate/2-oxoglutarate dehydrogenase complex dihydrolipoamide acyltransferase (E2) component
MKQLNNNYSVRKFSPFRRASKDLFNAAKRKNMIHALIQVDITDTRYHIRELRNEEKKYLSLIGYILFCTGKAVNNYKNFHAYRDWRNRLIIFDSIDISATVEKKISDEYVVVPEIIRDVNHKDFFQISEELKNAKEEPVHDAEVYKSIKKYLLIPCWIRHFIFHLLDRFPLLMKKKAGTVMLTSAHSGGNQNVWGIPIASHTLNITIGGISKQPKLIDGKIEERELLCITISIDHNIIDGANASRFISYFQKLVQTEINQTKK